MIKNANLSPRQEEIVKEACAIQIDALISVRCNVHELRAYCLSVHEEDYSEDELLKAIDDLMNTFNDLRHSPQTLLSFEKKITDQVQIVIQWYIDKYDGNPEVNRLFSKFIKGKEFKAEILSIN
jgi:hypothetical protein